MKIKCKMILGQSKIKPKSIDGENTLMDYSVLKIKTQIKDKVKTTKLKVK